jgi:hypothetical protein
LADADKYRKAKRKHPQKYTTTEKEGLVHLLAAKKASEKKKRVVVDPNWKPTRQLRPRSACV